MSHGQTMGRLEWGLLLFLSLLWGASFFFFKVLVTELPPFTIVLGRVAIASVVLNILLRVQGGHLPTSGAEWRDHFILAVTNYVMPYALIAYGEKHISSGLASILNAMVPIFTMLMAHALTRSEKLSWNKAAGVAFGLIGVVCIVGPSALQDIGGRNLLGEFACLTAAVLYGFGNVFGRRFRGWPLLQVATSQVTASLVVVLPLACFVDHPWTLPLPSLPVWGALIGLALLSTVVAYNIYFHILSKAGSTNISQVAFLVPISAVLLGIAFLGETLSANALAGMAVIGLGLAAIDGRLLRWLKRSTPA
jgi:drug/metabolite transporter (DMT)-like permease